ncbi:endolytic transglycosylase MltG [Streptomyces mexicanus]|uniref:endolytic transglycosylase MltG n=1 Tax=Streptomyces mexicanus TaxID=178566 RepID=UPI0031EDEA49
MTEYGRGPGPEPWHPEDPLYGDVGWTGQQGHTDPQSSYGGHAQQPQYGDWGQAQQPGYGGQHQHYDAQGNHQPSPYDDHAPYDPQGRPQPVHQGGPDHQQYPGQAQEQYRQDGWDGTGTHTHLPYPGDLADPYGQQQAMAYGPEQPDPYGGAPEAYPPPQPPNRRHTEPETHPDRDPEPGSDEQDHAFFSGAGHDDEDAPAADDPAGRRSRGERRGRGGRNKGGRKRRNGLACLVVAVVLGGGAAGVAYYGYHFYQNRFGPAPDYAGDGTGETVTVEIPEGAGGYDIGRALKKAGVVKSVDAFVAAQSQNPKGKQIQAGAYLLNKQMSAASAVALMLDPRSQSNVLVKPGERNAQVYAAIDKRLDLADGTTKKIAAKEYKNLGLPSWANSNSQIMDPLEGFLHPGTYPAAKGMKPETILKNMVEQAGQAYNRYDLAAKAKDFGLSSPLELVTVASLVQAEGKTHDDFRMMAEVVYNRLKPTNTETNQKLQFDSTFNYLKGESNIHISEKEINSNQSPYNTYTHKGLPPGPIGNPGDDALKAALNPTDEGWIYFVATDGMNKTEFAKTYADFLKLKDKFDASSVN